MNKKKILKLIIIITFIILVINLINTISKKTYSLSTEKENDLETYGTYEEAKKIVQEVMKAYYVKGPYIQYHSSRAYNNESPELATSQYIKYEVCSQYIYDIYKQGFGMNVKATTSDFSNAVKDYYRNNTNLDGNYVIYYEGTKEDLENDIHVEKYIYNNNRNLSDFAQNIQPGDIFTYTGHTLVAYDKVQKQDGTWDVLLLNSTGAANSSIKSRIKASNRTLIYNTFKSSYGNNNIIDVNAEGTIRWIWLSKVKNLVNNNEIKCARDECTVLRPYYNSNGKAKFNFAISEKQYQKGYLRTKFPGLSIEKTVDKNTNNSVYPNNNLTYKIKIKNMSDVTYDGIDYEKFIVEEELSDYVEYISSNGIKKDNHITYTIDKLKKNESVELTYTVKVKDNSEYVNEIVEANGKFYKYNEPEVYISTGNLKNKIIPKVTQPTNSYKECYNMGKINKSNLELIDYIYNCARNKDYNFDEFDFSKLFERNTKTTSDVNTLFFKSQMDENHQKFEKMVLNNYWGGMVKREGETAPLVFRGAKGEKRNKKISDLDFKDGDILIYSINYDGLIYNNETFIEAAKPSDRHTDENGLYTYIYIDGKFVGNNYSGEENERNEFTWNYYETSVSKTIKNDLYSGYEFLEPNDIDRILTHANYETLLDKDYYVILRPELVIKEVDNISIKEISKTNYIQNSENLDLKGSKIQVNYNDGTNEEIEINANNISQFEVSGFDNTKLGTNKVTIKYQNVTTTFNVNIVAKQPTKLEIVKGPNKQNYIQNTENIDIKGCQIKVSYNDTTSETITVDENNKNQFEVSGFNNTKLGTNKVTIKYQNVTTTFNVNIVAKQPTKLEIVKGPNKQNYIQNTENIDIKGCQIKVSYNDTTSETITVDENNKNQFEVSGFNNTKLGTNKVTIKYQNVTTTFNVNIVEDKKYIINKYFVDEEKGYISKIDVNTTINDFKKNIELSEGYAIEIDNKNKDVLCTGSKTKLNYNGVLDKEFTNIVSGDVDGNGKVDYLDCVRVYSHIQKVKMPNSDKTLLVNEYQIAADFDYDNKIAYMDCIRIYNKIKELKGGVN